MANKQFDPSEWLQDSPNNDKENAPKSAPIIPLNSNNLDADIQALVEQVEVSGIDITAGYKNWLDIGFALVEAFGEDGRDYFHRLSCFNAGYDHAEADRQYTHCLQSRGSGITPRTLFHIAKQHGILPPLRGGQGELSSISSKSSVSAPPVSEQLPNREHISETIEQLAKPTFSDKVREQLPDFLKEVLADAITTQDADILILGTLTVISACMPNIYGIYANDEVYPNLFLFVTAPPSAGKGRLEKCRLIVQPIHDNLLKIYDAQMEEYVDKQIDFEDRGCRGERPVEPVRQLLFIPADASASKFKRTLKDNGETGLIFETEGDTMANAFKSEYGQYSDAFRKAFHHECITYIRVKDNTYIEIKKPRLSAVLSGTPDQIQGLIPNAANGLFSRFMFYCLNIDLKWHNVFDKTICNTDEHFRQLGNQFYDLFQILMASSKREFCFTPQQEERFLSVFQEIQDNFYYVLGGDFLATTRRLGLITFRIAMILSVLRTLDDGEFPAKIICKDADFDTAITITKVIIQHASYIFQGLPQCASSNPVLQLTRIRQNFLAALPAQFNRETYVKIAHSLCISPKTAEKHISFFVKNNFVIREAHNSYKKNVQ
jgi:hypothetical protein